MVMHERGKGKVVFAEIGFPASFNDLHVLKSSRLFANRRTRDAFFEHHGPIVADMAYRSAEFPHILTPAASPYGSSLSWVLLPPDVQNWSRRLDAIENRTENVFAEIFRNQFALLKRHPFPNSSQQIKNLPQLIKCALILYNMQIDDTGESIFDPKP